MLPRISIIVLSLPLLFGACASELKEPDPHKPIRPIDPSTNKHVTRFLSGNFRLAHRTRQIDPAVLALLRSKLGADARLAEPNEMFQGSDVIDPRNFPRRQFVLAGSEPGFWFVDYIHGGYAPCHHLVLFSQANTEWTIVFAGDLFPKQKALDGIRSAVKNGRLLPQTGPNDY
jgi:hypothetical protein